MWRPEGNLQELVVSCKFGSLNPAPQLMLPRLHPPSCFTCVGYSNTVSQSSFQMGTHRSMFF